MARTPKTPEDVVSSLEDSAALLEEELHNVSKRFAQTAKKLTKTATTEIHQHPLAAFAIAFAAGVIVARWLRSDH